MKGNLVRTSYSEITATLELLATFGVNSEHLEVLRKAASWNQMVTAKVIQGDSFLMALLALEDNAKKVGFRETDLASVSGDAEKLQQVLSFLRGFAQIEMIDHLIDCDVPVFVPEKWEVLPNEKQLPKRIRGKVGFNSMNVALHLVNGQKNGKCIEGNKLRKVLVKQAVYTAHVLDYLLKPENLHLIPEEWKGKAVFFWGTIYRISGGSLFVRCLCWCGTGWCWGCHWLGGGFRGNRPAAVPATLFISPPHSSWRCFVFQSLS